MSNSRKHSPSPDQLYRKVREKLHACSQHYPEGSPEQKELQNLIREMQTFVAETKEQRRLLNRSQETFDSIIDQVDEYAIILLDKEGKIMSWNRGVGRINGYDKEEIVGRSFRVFYSEEDIRAGKPERLLEQARRTGRAQDESYRIRKDGSMFWGSVVITALHDRRGHVNGFLKVTRDLTDRKQGEDRLKEQKRKLEALNRELEAFSYTVSHDLRSPLRAVQGYSRILDEEFARQLGEEGRRILGNISRNAFRMGSLIDDLLEFSRLNRTEIQRSRFEPGRLVRELLSELDEIGDARIDVLPMPDMVADHSLISQVYFNLITNAVKFSSKVENPTIEIGAQETENGTIWYVKDNGTGFDMKYSGKMFHVFQRLHSEEEYEGTGVGLAIVERVIKRHGGDVWAEASPGKGATFFFTLGEPDRDDLNE